MKIFKISTIFDYIFVNVIFFLPFLMWLKYLTKNGIIALSVSLILLLPINIFFIYLNNKKNVKKKISTKLQEDIDDYFLSLLSGTRKENLKFFNNILKNKNSKTSEIKNIIVLEKENKKIVYCPLFDEEFLTFETAIKQIAIANKEKAYTIIILCANIDTKIKLKLENLTNVNLKIYNKFDIYENIFKKHNIYPTINFTQKQKSKLNLKLLYEISFQKSNAKKFFLSGIFLFFCSFFIRNNIYYILFSSISFFLCFLCFFNNPKQTQK